MTQLEDLLRAVGTIEGDADTPLELSSLAVIQLVDLIEATFGVVLTSADVTRTNFATRARLLALIEARR